tara:strand:- start:34 stop:570 length:537 start_codon:yes stop_codon:yes gene_type:complete
MRNITNVFLGVVLSITLFSCGESKKKQSGEGDTPTEVKEEQAQTADVVDQKFNDGITGNLWHYYNQVRLALINSDEKGVKIAAGNLAENLDEKPDLEEIANNLSASENLEEQRKLFADFSNEAEAMFKETLSEGKIYKLYCPMAFNEGAYWLSSEKEIMNPYFGEKMLNCGTVDEIIE